MQDNKQQTLNASEDEEYREFKRVQKMNEAKANVSKIECDCLSPLMDKVSLKEMCKSANAIEMGGIVVPPNIVKACVSYLGKDPKVSLIAGIGFPYGGELTEIKAAAVKRAVRDGVDEAEVWAPTVFLRDGNFAYFKKECKKIKKAGKNCAVRVVLDCKSLGEKELVRAAVTAVDTGIDCVRLSGADGELVAKVKAALKGRGHIKADRADSALAFVNLCTAGADTVGCTSALDLANYLLKQAEAE